MDIRTGARMLIAFLFLALVTEFILCFIIDEKERIECEMREKQKENEVLDKLYELMENVTEAVIADNYAKAYRTEYLLPYLMISAGDIDKITGWNFQERYEKAYEDAMAKRNQLIESRLHHNNEGYQE